MFPTQIAYIFLLAVSLGTFRLAAQQPIREQNVLEALAGLDQALIDRDPAALSALTAEQLSYGHSSGIIQDKQEFLDDVLHGPFRFLTITHENRRVILHDNMAIVRFILSADAENAGSPTQVRIGVMMVFAPDPKDKIVLIARQAYKL